MTAPPFKSTALRGPDSLGISVSAGIQHKVVAPQCVHLQAWSAQVLTWDGMSLEWANEILKSL